MKRKTERARLVEELDKLFSLFIRLRDKKLRGPMCPFCHTRPSQGCFHFRSRIYTATRWDPDNACASCNPCNGENEYRPAKYEVWFWENRGKELWEEVTRRSLVLVKWGVPELREKLSEVKIWLTSV